MAGSSRRALAVSKAESTLFINRELVDVEAAQRLLESKAMAKLRDTNEPYWSSVSASVKLAVALGGYLPVRYYMHEARKALGG